MSTNETLDLFRLDDSVAIVTGAAGLLGKQHCLALADSGAHVVVTDLRLGPCEERADCLAQRTGRRMLAAECDVTSKTSWERLLEMVLAEFGRLDVLINNAGFTNQSPSPEYGSPAEDFPLSDWEQILAVNLTGTFLGCQVAGRQMLKQSRGSIINLASLYGVVSPHHRIYPDTGLHQPIPYAVSKTGVIGLTRYLATAWAERGVRVNCITPGGVDNDHPALFASRYAELSPIGRMARSDELRGALVYLASPASAYCTGHNLVVDGGWTAW